MLIVKFVSTAAAARALIVVSIGIAVAVYDQRVVQQANECH